MYMTCRCHTQNLVKFGPLWIVRFTQKCSYSAKNFRGDCFRPGEVARQILARLDHFEVNRTIHPNLLWLDTSANWRLSLVLWSSPHAQNPFIVHRKVCLSCKASCFLILATIYLNNHNFGFKTQTDELLLIGFIKGARSTPKLEQS